MSETTWRKSVVASVPQLARGRVWCRTCGATQRVDSAGALSHGWPKCCGYTMIGGRVSWRACRSWRVADYRQPRGAESISGAAMSETAVERRLREMASRERHEETFFGSAHTPVSDAIDAGREAIALVRRYRDGDDDGLFVKHAAALLARCEGEK